MRVLVAGMGSAIGTAVARRLESDPSVDAIEGFDLEPPRRWLRRAEFHFARPGDGERVTRIVTEFEPTVVVHAWVFEPRARSSPGQARARTVAGTESLLGALSKVDTVEHLAVRSGVSVYSSRRRQGTRPTVETALRPTSTFGKMLARVEQRCIEAASQLNATVAPVRLGAVMAANLPNPLGRYLRLPVMAVPITTRRFAVVHLDDAGAGIAAAATRRHVGPLNVIATGSVTPLEAVTLGARLPLPVLPIALRLGRGLTDLVGAPLPEHVVELLVHGQVVEPSDLTGLETSLQWSTADTIRDLYRVGRLVDVEVDRSASSIGGV